MTRIRIYPYKQGSRSARALADALGGRVLKLEGSRFRPRNGDFIINWGSSEWPYAIGQLGCEALNHPMDTQAATDKLRAFQRMQAAGVRVPEFWTDRANIPADAYPIVCRTVLNGHSGRGIVMADGPEQLVDAPLYVRYVRKQDEYRVHVVGGEVIAVQRKARRLEVADPDWRVRNHANGFNFVRDGVRAPDDVVEQAKASIIALGLDFGAVDVIWNERSQQAYVLEVNTAPGLEGTTVADYAGAFQRIVDERR